MEELNLILGLSTVSIGIFFIILDDFTTARVAQIGMNHYYNMRIRKAFESKENWYKINCFGARQWIIFSVLMIHIRVISFFYIVCLAPFFDDSSYPVELWFESLYNCCVN